jgi:hypothetical protein
MAQVFLNSPQRYSFSPFCQLQIGAYVCAGQIVTQIVTRGISDSTMLVGRK